MEEMKEPGLTAQLQAGPHERKGHHIQQIQSGTGYLFSLPKPYLGGDHQALLRFDGGSLPVPDGCPKVLLCPGSSCALWGLILQVKLHLNLKPDTGCPKALQTAKGLREAQGQCLLSHP